MHIRTLSVCLLFSLFVFFIGCKKDVGQELENSFARKDYAGTVKTAQTLLKNSVQAEYLFWEAKANDALGNTADAYRELSLYLAMIDHEVVSWRDAHELMCRIGFQQKQYQRVIESAGILEQSGWLGGELPQYYYQALVATNQADKANQVFKRYLKDTVDAYQYALLLVTAKASIETLFEAFLGLTADEQLALLEFAASDTVRPDYAKGLLKLAVPLEKSYTDSVGLKRVYLVLEKLYGYADQRVLQRKYETLANT